MAPRACHAVNLILRSNVLNNLVMNKILYVISITLILLAVISRVAVFEETSIHPCVGFIGLVIGIVTVSVDAQKWMNSSKSEEDNDLLK